MWGDGVEEFRSDWEAERGDAQEERAGETQAAVDAVGAVEEGVVDQTFPARRCAGFLAIIRSRQCSALQTPSKKM